MPEQKGLLSIIIVNYHSGNLVLNCIQSILDHHVAPNFEYIVVDNSNSHQDELMICNRFPFVQWVDMGYNAGFARANNAGMRLAKGDAFLLLNPDTIALDQSIAVCYQQLKAGNFCAAGVQLLDAAHAPQISGSRFVQGGLNHLLPIPYWGAFIRWAAYSAGSKAPGVQDVASEQQVDWISGAFLMVQRNAVATAGLMDEDFFLYGEEVEWCSRLKKVGQLVLFGNLKIIHLEGATINKSQNIQEQGYYNLYDRKGLQLMVSNHLRVRKQYGVGWFLFLLLNYTWGWLFFLLCSTVYETIRAANPFKQGKKVFAFGRNVARLWFLTPAIMRNKPRFYKMF
ncbi:family 2 glycosyl transferase [Cnuella takakiae]|nr:family 2 glycosyl transferase [Cnuella takakiae]